MPKLPKHHYIPVFYLKRWHGPDNRLCVFSRPHGSKVKPQRKNADGTGYERGLYSAQGLPAGFAEALEQEFLKPADHLASLALEKLIASDCSHWSNEMRSAWTKFIGSLLLRYPEAIASIRRHMNDIVSAAQPLVKKAWLANHPHMTASAFDSAFAEAKPTLADSAAFRLARQVIDNATYGPAINAMHWSVLHLKNARDTLLTSDRPVFMPRGVDRPDSFIALPIGPRSLFVAAREPSLEKELGAQDHNVTVRRMNTSVVERAKAYVWGVSDSTLRFVQKHMSTVPDRVILTEEQKQSAIDAVLGRKGDRQGGSPI